MLIQMVKYDEEQKFILLNGLLSLESSRRFNKENANEEIREVECEFYKDEVLDIKTDSEELGLEYSFRKVMHGDRLSLGDRKFQARRIVEANHKLENMILMIGMCSIKFHRHSFINFIKW